MDWLNGLIGLGETDLKSTDGFGDGMDDLTRVKWMRFWHEICHAPYAGSWKAIRWRPGALCAIFF
jgi:hypothetical protein